MQRHFFNITDPAAPLPSFHCSPFPVNPCYVSTVPIPSSIDVNSNETSNNTMTNRINEGSTQMRISLGLSNKNSVFPTKSSPNHFVPSIVVSNIMSLAPKTTERPDIACFTETWLKDSRDDNVINILDYSVV